MRPRIVTRQVLVHITAMVTVLVGLVLVRPGVHNAQAQVDLGSGLLVTTRDQFRMCVETTPALAEQVPSLLAQLSDQLLKVRQHRDWEAAGLGSRVPELEVGCPGAQLPTTQIERGTAVGPGVVTDPSPYRTTIFLLDDATAERVLSTRNAALQPFEVMQVGEHQYAEVTSALLVRESFLGSAELIDPYLTLAVGLEPRVHFMPPEDERGVK